jgi:integrase
MPQYRIGKLGGRFVLVWTDRDGKRRRYRLDARNAGAAAHEAPGLFAILNRPKGKTVAEIWHGFIEDRAGRAIVATMPYHWKSLGARFDKMAGDAITIEDCRAYADDRRKAGIKDGSIYTELGRLRMVLRWAEKHGIITRASPIERPAPPKRKDRHLTRDECRALIGAAAMPHVRLYIVLALGTGARNAALLELTWDRCDFDRQLIDLRNPQISRPHKGRAIVPMNRPVLAALLEARPGSLSDHVIEWAARIEASRAARWNWSNGLAASAASFGGRPYGRGRDSHGRDRADARS